MNKDFKRLDGPFSVKTWSPFYSHQDNKVNYSAVKGSKAIFRALLIALVICLWCLAQLPEILRGIIFPLSVIKALSLLASL